MQVHCGGFTLSARICLSAVAAKPMKMKTAAVMQPYFIPYLGYYQLMSAVDVFVIYDDIEYSKQSWINRNRLLLKNGIDYITLPLAKGPDVAHVRDRCLASDWPKHRTKYLNRVEQAYKDRAQFQRGMELLNEIFNTQELNLFAFLKRSIDLTCQALNLKTPLLISSEIGDFRNLSSANKVQSICKAIDAEVYINPIGGQNLYSESDFEANGLKLGFIQTDFMSYQQNNSPQFYEGLSILDLIMSEDCDAMQRHLRSFQIISAGQG